MATLAFAPARPPQFLEVPAYRNTTLKCLTEIGGLAVGPEYNRKFLVLFSITMQSIQSMIPLTTGMYCWRVRPRAAGELGLWQTCERVQADFASAYENSSDRDQEFIQNLA